MLGEVAIYNNKITHLPHPSKNTWTMVRHHNPIEDNLITLGYIDALIIRKKKEDYEYYKNSYINNLAFDEFVYYIDVLHKITS